MRTLTVALLALLTTTCTDTPTGPQRTAHLTVQPVLAAGLDVAAFNLVIDNLRIVVVRAPEQIIRDTTVSIPAGADSVELDILVPLIADREVLSVTLELRAGVQVLFSGTQDVEVQAGAPDPQGQAAEIPVTFAGPGQNVARLAVAPADSVVTIGGTAQYRVSAFDGADVPVSQFFVAWSATTPEPQMDRLGVLQAPGTRGTTYVKAVTPTGVADSALVTFIPVPTEVQAAAGDGQSLPIGSAANLEALVVAADGLGVKGTVVQFQAVSGGGTVETPQAVTDDAGRAVAAVTLGTVSGPQIFEASVSGIPPATFTLTALAGSATDLLLVSGDAQRGPVAAPLAQPLVVRATDQFGNGVAGVSVDFAVTGGGGSLSAPQVITGATGDASVTLQLGTTAGANTVEATLPAVSPLPVVTFTATGTPAAPASLEFVVEPSNTLVNAVIAPSVDVAVRDPFGNLTTNQATLVSVALGANPGGGSLQGTAQATTVNGIATFGDLSITAAGFGYTILASAAGLPSVPSVAFDILPPGGGSVWVGGDSDWSNAANWSTGLVPTGVDDVLVPASAPSQPTLTAAAFANALTVESGATLNTNGFTITVNGNVDAGTSITGSGTVEVAGTGVTLAGAFPNVTVSGTATALAGTLINGNLLVTGGTGALQLAGDVIVAGALTASASEVVLNGNPLTVTGNLTTSGSGAAIVMTQAADLLVIGGNASFGGSTPAGGLSAGEILLNGGFTQAGSLNGFQASGTHRVVFLGTGTQTISMANPGPTDSHFQEVDVTNPAGIDVTSTVLALGTLATAGPAPVSGAGTFQAEGDVTIGGDATLSGLAVGGALAVGGTYSVGTTTFSGTGQTIPAGLAYQNLTVTGSSATYAGTTISGALAVQGAGAGLTVTGDLSVGSNLTVNGDNASVTLGGATTIPGALTLNSLGGPVTVTLGGITTVGTDLTTTFGAVVLNGTQLTVTGNLATVGTGGTVVMSQPSDLLVIGGNASFGGSTQVNGLSAGEIQLSGDFTQAGSLNGFQASGTHRVVFRGTGAQTISMANPGPTASHFQELELDQSFTVDLATNVLALGGLVVPAIETPTITGNGNVLTVGGLTVDNATFDNAPLVSTGGTLAGFDNVTFQNMDVAATQLTITHPGAATPFTFTNLAFLTTPVSGLYISATDNLADANTLQLDLVGSTPSDGSTFTTTANGAIVNWPGVGPVQWINAAGGLWNDPANWSGNAVPGPANDVEITLDGTYTVTLDVAAAVASVTVGAATGTQTLDLGGQALTVSNAFATQSGGTLTMTTSTAVLTVQGDATFGGASTDGLLTDGVVSVARNFVQAGAGNSYRTTGTHRTALNGTAAQTVDFGTPGSSFVASQFQDLEISGTGDVTFLTTVNVTDSLIVQNAITLTADNSILMGQTGALVTPVGSNLNVANELRIPSELAVNGGFSALTTFFQGTGQVIPASLPYTNLTVFGNSASFGAGTPTINGDLLVGRLNNFFIGNLTLSGTTVVTGNVLITSSAGSVTNLTVNGQNLTVGGNLQTQATGVFTMTDPADRVTVTGNALFQGGSTDGRLTAGLLLLSGNFTQSIGPTAFRPSGTHRTVFNGTNPSAEQTIAFVHPDTVNGSYFHDLELRNTGQGIRINSTVPARGQLISTSATTPRLVGFSNLVVTGVDVDGLVMETAPLIVNGGTIRLFDNVTFQTYATDATQLTVNHPGAAAPFTFNNATFLTTPATGFYVSANDLAPTDGNVLTLEMAGSTPADGSIFEEELGGAIINWPGAGPAPQIVFAGDSLGGTSGFYRVDPDGSNLVFWTPEGPSQRDFPRWSPDRTRIVYTTSDNIISIPNLLHVASPDGLELAHLVNDTSTQRARYNATGQHLAFQCGPFFAPDDVCTVANVDGPIALLDNIGDGAGKVFVTDLVATRASGVAAFGWDPANGNRLAFVRDSITATNDPASRIYTVNFDGTGLDETTFPAVMDVGKGPLQVVSAWLDYSPDGSQIVFAAIDPSFEQNIYRINKDGTGLVALTSGPDIDDDPLWSPNGLEILFSRDVAPTFCSLDAWLMNSDGTAQRRITDEQVCDFDTSILGYDWSPDGSEIVLTGFNTFGSVLIYVIKRTTTAASYFADRRLVGRGAVGFEVQDIQPSWRP